VLLHFTSHASEIKLSIDALPHWGHLFINKKKEKVMCFFTEICILILPAVHCLILSTRGSPKTGMCLVFCFPFSCLLHGFFVFVFLMFYLCLIATYDIDYAISFILYNHYVSVCVFICFSNVSLQRMP
jgi:hypothetical protein